MRILYLCADPGVPILGRKGCSTHVREVVRALHRAGHEVRILCANRGDDSGEGWDDLDIVEVAPLTSKMLGFDLRLLLFNRRFSSALKAQIASFKPHALYERFSLYSISGHRLSQENSQLPRLLEVNAFLSQEQSSRIHFPMIARYVDHLVVRNAQQVIVVSEPLRQEVAQLGIPLENIHKMPMCADILHFHPDKNGAEVRARYGFDGKYVIGYVGTLTGWHGINMLYDVANKMKSEMDNFVFFLVGGDELKAQRHREKSRELGLESHFVFAGSIPYCDVPEHIRAMDVTLVPDTTSWSSPTKLFEYQASGVPTVAPRYSAVVEAMEEGVEGLLFEPRNVDQFAKCLIELSKDPLRRVQMGDNARARVVETHSIDQQVRKLIQIYEEMGAGTPALT